MIASIFSKSKPINFVIIATLIVFLFVITNFSALFSESNNVLTTTSRLVVTLFLVFLLDFIISKNNITQSNGYAILSFGLFFGLFPEAMKSSELLLANLFIMLALRRILSLHSRLNIKKKLFDAAFWIGLATLCFFWSILFFAVVIVALIYYSQNEIKNLIIPFVGLITVLILLMSYNIVFHDAYFLPSNFQRFSSLDYTSYNSAESIMKLTLLFASFIWVIIYYFKALPGKNKNLRPSFFLVAWASIIAVLIAIIAPSKNGSEFIFLFAPFSILMANYIETISERWFKEVFISLFILTPIVSLFL